MPKIKHLTIPKPEKGRRFAISDVHGCYETFLALLNQIGLKKKDHLYLVGDMVNRGPASNQVLNHIMELQKKGYQLFFIRGNHEQIVINASKKTAALRKRTLNAYNSSPLLDGPNIKEDYLSLLKRSYHFLDLGDYYLVHAGFDFSKENPFENKHQMMNIRNFKVDKIALEGRRMVIGHSPKRLSEILKRIHKNKTKIYIDNGCVNKSLLEQGSLLCLNLDTNAVSIQKNIDL